MQNSISAVVDLKRKIFHRSLDHIIFLLKKYFNKAIKEQILREYLEGCKARRNIFLFNGVIERLIRHERSRRKKRNPHFLLVLLKENL